MLKRFLQLFIFFVAVSALSFSSAGRLDWWRAWIYLALYAVTIAVNAAIVLRTNPEVIRARAEMQAGAKGFDKVIVSLYTLLTLALPVVAGLDAVRFQWAPLPFAALYFGAALFLFSMIPVTWSMAVNPYLETTVRIQNERGHVAITSGPYRFVRHPMYAGVILSSLATPLIFGSAWSFVPAALIAVLFVIRTALEDRTLQSELPGYADYAQRTRYRLFPAVW
jgi:protein-S-isoprenylcysteine O-methyltransferase Ste14